jgi:hypothetical protein
MPVPLAVDSERRVRLAAEIADADDHHRIGRCGGGYAEFLWP